MDVLGLIDWRLVGFGALWLLGLSVLLAAVGFAEDQAGRQGMPRRQVWRQAPYPLVLNLGTALFCLGWLGLAAALWERIAWAGLAGYFGFQAGLAIRHDLPRWRWPGVDRGSLTRWLWPEEAPAPEHLRLRLVLLVGLLHGLLYVYLLPPWQHYDEPGHFEYAWLIANRPGLPELAEFDPGLRRALALSMLDHGFFRDLGFTPDLNAPDGQIWIGEVQTGAPPLIYILLSTPLRLFFHGQPYADLPAQLHAARLVSLAFFLLSLWLAYRLVAELTPPGHPLRLAVPALLALLPAFVDSMTAVSDDPAAVALFTLFLWAGIYLIRRGLSLERLAAVLVLAGLCVVAKNTLLLALPLLIVGLLLVLARTRPRLLSLGLALAAGAGVLLCVVSLRWGEVAYWYQPSATTTPTRVRVSGAPLGEHALALELTPGVPWVRLVQPLPPQAGGPLKGRTVTMGAWLWASRPVTGTLPRVSDRAWDLADAPQEVALTTQPVFYAYRTQIPAGAREVRVFLDGTLPLDESAVTLYYDGLVLLEGEWPLDRAPEFGRADGAAGTWGGQVFQNRLRNGSAEAAWPGVRPEAEAIFRRLAGHYLSPGSFLAGVLDFDYTRGYLALTSIRLFHTFWAVFAWGQVYLHGAWYWTLLAATLAALVGAAGRLWRVARGERGLWLALLWLGSAAALVWGSVLLRGLFTILYYGPLLPVARYAHPVVVPTALLLAAGGLAWLRRAPGWLKWLPWIGLAGLDLAAVWTVLRYF